MKKWFLEQKELKLDQKESIRKEKDDQYCLQQVKHNGQDLFHQSIVEEDQLNLQQQPERKKHNYQERREKKKIDEKKGRMKYWVVGNFSVEENYISWLQLIKHQILFNINLRKKKKKKKEEKNNRPVPVGIFTVLRLYWI